MYEGLFSHFLVCQLWFPFASLEMAIRVDEKKKKRSQNERLDESSALEASPDAITIPRWCAFLFFSFCRSPFWTVDRKKDVVAPRRRRQLIRVVSSFCGRSSTAPRCREQQHQGDAADDHPKKTAATTTTMRDKSPGNRPAHPFPNWLFFPSFFGC